MSAVAQQQQTGTDTLALVLFQVGRWRVGVEAHRVRACRTEALGNAAIDAEALLGFPPERPTGATPRTCWLQCIDAAGEREVCVADPVELRCLPLDRIHRLPPLLAARSTLRGLRALALPTPTEGEFLLLFGELPAQPD